MKTADFGKILRDELGTAGIPAPERTGLYDTANDNLGMVTAYCTDADAFLAAGDVVNAAAAYCYGSGWLHCGAACGLVTLQQAVCPLADPPEPLPALVREKLKEKTHRYQRILTIGCAAVHPAAEQGTAPQRTAERIHAVITFYAGQGARFLAQGKLEYALACFSYGHGWLDAGVRAGLFSVLSDRELFTI